MIKSKSIFRIMFTLHLFLVALQKDTRNRIMISICSVVSRQRDLLKERQFIIWSKNLHLQYGLKPDIQYPAEIMTLTDLNEAISYIDVVELELKNNSQKLFDYTTWIQILADKKIAMMGDLQLLNELSIKCQQFPELWKKQILTKLQSQVLYFS